MRNNSPDTGKTARASLQVHQNIICCVPLVYFPYSKWQICIPSLVTSTNFREAIQKMRNVCSVIEGID